MEEVIASFGASKEEMKANLEYYKRDDIEIDGFRRRFWFRNKYVNFHADLYGKDLYDFLDNYEIGGVYFALCRLYRVKGYLAAREVNKKPQTSSHQARFYANLLDTGDKQVCELAERATRLL